MAVTLTDKVRFYESVFGSGRMARNCRNFDVRCPVCLEKGPVPPDKKKLAILTEDDRCHCWVCGYKSRTLAPLIRKYGTHSQLQEYVQRFMPAGTSTWHPRCMIITGEAPPPPPIQLPKDFKLFAASRSRDPDVAAMRRYLVQRGLSDDDLWFYKLGYSNEPMWHRRVIMPSFDKDGALNHFVGRTIDKGRKPKYESPEGDRRQVIFNEINIDWSRQLVVCEGAFDLVKCGDNAVPLLGSDLNEESALFNAIVAHGTPVALALDADMRLTKMPRVAQKLADYNIDVVLVEVTTDPGDMTQQQFKAAKKAARPFDWNLTFFDKLAHAAHVRL